MIRSFALLMLMLLTACGSAIDVQYQSRTDEKADILPRLTKTVETKTIYNSPLPLRDSYTAYSHNDIDKCFNPEIRAGKYDSLGTKLYITEKKTEPFPQYSYQEILDKLCNQYGANNDLRKARPELLKCFTPRPYGYGYLLENSRAECKTFANTLKIREE